MLSVKKYWAFLLEFIFNLKIYSEYEKDFIEAIGAK